MTRPAKVPSNAVRSEFGNWIVTEIDDCYETTYFYDDEGNVTLILEVEV